MVYAENYEIMLRREITRSDDENIHDDQQSYKRFASIKYATPSSSLLPVI